ncbi:MAG: heme transporter CcmC, partial [Nitrosarchaeum sp.]|nr:heme transporter CcmC [Nitrosarchaeum sp.]
MILIIIPAADYVFAAGDEPAGYLDRRVVIWNLFYKMMTVAFTVGSVVSGTIIWICWRFRESHPKA